MSHLATAKIILRAAANLGVKVGTDGDELVAVIPLRLPAETCRWFEAVLDHHQAAVIAVIMAENAMVVPNITTKAV
jgi:hypothetical protein